MTHHEMLKTYESEATGAFASAEFVATFMQDMPAPDSDNATEADLQNMAHLRRILAVAERIVGRYVST
jgi:hypothetical protein